MNKLVLTGLLAAGTMTHLQGAQPAGQRPNILFILSDLPSLGHLWRSTGRICPQRQHPPAGKRRGSARQLFLHQLYLSTQPCQYPHRSIQSPEQTVHPCGLTGHLHPHPCHPATSQRIPHRTRRQMAYPVATARIRLLLHLLRSRRIP